MKNFIKADISELDFNVFEKIDKQWLMICTKDENNERVNIMTASWADMGILWRRPVCTLYVRPQRHTFSLINSQDRLAVCVLPESQREAMRFCGTKSGRDYDKFKETGLSEIEVDGTGAIGESDMIFVLKKLYQDTIKKENFTDNAPLCEYPRNDFHAFYICEIESVYIAK